MRTKNRQNIAKTYSDIAIPLLHTEISVRASTSWRPFLITNKEKCVVAELPDTVAKQAFRTENICFKE